MILNREQFSEFIYKEGQAEEKTATWEVFTDVYNNKYFYCTDTQSAAYFINDGTMFYFTAFYGDHNSLLYYFYLTAYKVLLGYHPDIEITDHFPIHIIRKNKISLWLHDIIAPFYQYLDTQYINRQVWSDLSVSPTKIQLATSINICSFKKRKTEGKGILWLAENQIKEFSFETSKTRIWAQSSNTLL